MNLHSSSSEHSPLHIDGPFSWDEGRFDLMMEYVLDKLPVHRLHVAGTYYVSIPIQTMPWLHASRNAWGCAQHVCQRWCLSEFMPLYVLTPERSPAFNLHCAWSAHEHSLFALCALSFSTLNTETGMMIRWNFTVAIINQDALYKSIASRSTAHVLCSLTSIVAFDARLSTKILLE